MNSYDNEIRISIHIRLDSVRINIYLTQFVAEVPELVKTLLILKCKRCLGEKKPAELILLVDC